MRIDDYVGGTDILGGYDVDGYDVGGTDIIGAGPVHPVVRQAQAKAQQHLAALRQLGYPHPSAADHLQMPGLRGSERVAVAAPDIARRQIAPLGQHQNATSVAATFVAALTFPFRPQRPFRIERLVMSCIDQTAGLDATYLLELTDFLVGAEPQLVNAGVVPGSLFAPNSFGVTMRGNTAEPGIDVTINFNLTVPGTGANPAHTYQISGAIVGTSLT